MTATRPATRTIPNICARPGIRSARCRTPIRQPVTLAMPRSRTINEIFTRSCAYASKDSDSPLIWTGGLFYSRLSENVPENIYDATLNQEVINYTTATYAMPYPVCYPGQECPGGLIYNGPVDSVIDKQVAAFGEVTFKFLDQFRATAGLRVSRLEYDGSVAGTGPFLGTTIITSSSAVEKPVTPKAVLRMGAESRQQHLRQRFQGLPPGRPQRRGRHDLRRQSRRDRRLASARTVLLGQPMELRTRQQRTTFFDHTLAVNASLFYIDWNNIQQNVYLPACGEQFTANLGKAKSEGGDLEVLYRPLDDAHLGFHGGLHRCASHQDLVRGRLVLQRQGLRRRRIERGSHCVEGERAARSALVISPARRNTIFRSGAANDPICDSTYSIRLPSDPCYPSKIRRMHFTIRPFPGCRWSTTYRHEPVFASMRSTSRSTPTILRIANPLMFEARDMRLRTAGEGERTLCISPAVFAHEPSA